MFPNAANRFDRLMDANFNAAAFKALEVQVATLGRKEGQLIEGDPARA